MTGRFNNAIHLESGECFDLDWGTQVSLDQNPRWRHNQLFINNKAAAAAVRGRGPNPTCGQQVITLRTRDKHSFLFRSTGLTVNSLLHLSLCTAQVREITTVNAIYTNPLS